MRGIVLAISSYMQNPLIHRDRRPCPKHSDWVRSFDCSALRPLIVCRGPIRKETMDVFGEMGIENFGILLSEKDSIVYTHALAPELRFLTDPTRVHRVPDYSGASREERSQRIAQIIAIAKQNSYNAVFAGYGFMAEEEEFVRAIEEAGLIFIGPCSRTVREAGRKDEAKRTAKTVGVSVTPGVDNVTSLTLLAKYPDAAALRTCAEQASLIFPEGPLELEALANQLLEASYERGIDLITIDEIAETVRAQTEHIWREFRTSRIRLKAIGGGGGKGQRILMAPAVAGEFEANLALATSAVASAVREVLGEVKANGVGDNKNMLLELNIEYTRHQEIQLIGNGAWCLALGARDCSLQMHEQKLLEVSNTVEELGAAIAMAVHPTMAAALQADLTLLRRMEEESERFGTAVGLDSVSTFECIVDRERYFFMEMNTRIQVEHRVTELCYALRFCNPDEPEDHFTVESLVEAMVLLALHKHRLPRPLRIPRNPASVEARLNATNAALAPHAGGIITFWSDPHLGEIRDDQGICFKNPDTGTFMKYRLAGAYDSNIALLVTAGSSRELAYESLSEVLRRTKLQGIDLATNLEFHYGLVNWFRARQVRAKATTRFIMPYLTLIGQLAEASAKIDLAWAFHELQQRHQRDYADQPGATAEIAQVMGRKRSLVMRPLEYLLRQPHVLSGWLSEHLDHFAFSAEGQLIWRENPVKILDSTYHFLNMDWRENALPAEIIWSEDRVLLERASNFYHALESRLGLTDYPQLLEALDRACPPSIEPATWQTWRAAHLGFNMGLELIGLLPLLAQKVGFFELRVNPDLTIEIPEHLLDRALQERMAKVLVPPPESGADEIVAVSGGMYYPREAPGMPALIEEGQHFEKGQPLFIIEVMKMFNKVYAPFSGTLDKRLVEGEGVIVSKGQALLKVTPDERVLPTDPKQERAQRIHWTGHLLQGL